MVFISYVKTRGTILFVRELLAGSIVEDAET